MIAVGEIKVMGDTSGALLVNTDGTQMQAAVDGRLGPALASQPVVIEAVELAAAPAAEAAVSTAIATEGIDRGLGRVPRVLGTGWAHVTQAVDRIVKRLPLGYATDGLGLDEYAIKVWKRDINEVVQLPADPVWHSLALNDDGKIVWGIKRTGVVVIPQLETPQGEAAPAADTAVALDGRVPRTGVARPYLPDSKRVATFGSSSAEFSHPELQAALTPYGVTAISGGKGGENVDQTIARLGSCPARLVFPGGIVPASGSVVVNTMGNQLPINSTNLLTFTGVVAGTGIQGTLAYSSAGLTFTRAAAGSATPVATGVEFLPTIGMAARDAIMMLWLGKNSLNTAGGTSAFVIEKTDEAVAWLSPLVKRVIVMGQFNDTNSASPSDTRTKIAATNAHQAAVYGDLFFDVEAWMAADATFAALGLTKTSADIAQIALGNKPPSLSKDNPHFTDAAEALLMSQVVARMRAHGWF